MAILFLESLKYGFIINIEFFSHRFYYLWKIDKYVFQLFTNDDNRLYDKPSLIYEFVASVPKLEQIKNHGYRKKC